LQNPDCGIGRARASPRDTDSFLRAGETTPSQDEEREQERRPMFSQQGQLP
jgi:hypothetical protein